MRAQNESRLVLIAVAVAVVVLLLFAVSLGAVLLVSRSSGAFDAAVTTPPGPDSRATTELPAEAGQSATSSSPVPSATSLLPATATIAPTTPAPTETPQLLATVAPLATVPAATPTPVVAPTIPSPTVLTPAESTVAAPSAFVYDGPSSNASIIGGVQQGDNIVILGSSGTWYLIQVRSTASPRSRIEGDQGWIAQDAVRPPGQPVPVITP